MQTHITIIGGIYRETGRLRDAAEEFKKAIQARPDFLSARSELASLLADGRDWQGAVEQYEQILKLRPGDLESRYGLVDALAHMGDHDRVITELQVALSLDKANPATHYNLGVALLAKGRRHEAQGRVPRGPFAETRLRRSTRGITGRRKASKQPVATASFFETRVMAACAKKPATACHDGR